MDYSEQSSMSTKLYQSVPNHTKAFNKVYHQAPHIFCSANNMFTVNCTIYSLTC